jgi:hypothetical protein
MMKIVSKNGIPLTDFDRLKMKLPKTIVEKRIDKGMAIIDIDKDGKENIMSDYLTDEGKILEKRVFRKPKKKTSKSKRKCGCKK